jgi:hypothetical protein
MARLTNSIGTLQQKYGYTKEQAEKELNDKLEAAKVYYNCFSQIGSMSWLSCGRVGKRG